MMGQFRIRIERDRQAQLSQGFLRLIVERQSWAEDAVASRPGWILPYGELQLRHCAGVVFFCHISVGQAGVSLLPLWMFAVKLAHFLNRGVELSLIAIRVAQIVADGGFLRRNSLGLAIFIDCLIKIALLV